VRNPYDPSAVKTPGGSSAGSAVSVACGIAFAALGTDDGGSNRIPAQFCGIVGMKPTFGLVPRTGVIPTWPYLDTHGPLARHVADAALLLDAIAGPDASDGLALTTPWTRGVLSALRDDALVGARLGLVDAHVPRTQMSAESLAVFDRAVADLQKAGARVEPCAPTVTRATVRDLFAQFARDRGDVPPNANSPAATANALFRYCQTHGGDAGFGDHLGAEILFPQAQLRALRVKVGTVRLAEIRRAEGPATAEGRDLGDQPAGGERLALHGQGEGRQAMALVGSQGDTALANPDAPLKLEEVRAVVGAYEAVVKQYPASSYSDNALWQAGHLALDAFWRFGQVEDKETFIRLLQKLVASYPTSKLAKQVPAELRGPAAVRPPSQTAASVPAGDLRPTPQPPSQALPPSPRSRISLPTRPLSTPSPGPPRNVSETSAFERERNPSPGLGPSPW